MTQYSKIVEIQIHLKAFIEQIKKLIPANCHRRICKKYIKDPGFYNILIVFSTFSILKNF